MQYVLTVPTRLSCWTSIVNRESHVSGSAHHARSTSPRRELRLSNINRARGHCQLLPVKHSPSRVRVGSRTLAGGDLRALPALRQDQGARASAGQQQGPAPLLQRDLCLDEVRAVMIRLGESALPLHAKRFRCQIQDGSRRSQLTLRVQGRHPPRYYRFAYPVQGARPVVSSYHQGCLGNSGT